MATVSTFSPAAIYPQALQFSGINGLCVDDAASGASAVQFCFGTNSGGSSAAVAAFAGPGCRPAALLTAGVYYANNTCISQDSGASVKVMACNAPALPKSYNRVQVYQDAGTCDSTNPVRMHQHYNAVRCHRRDEIAVRMRRVCWTRLCETARVLAVRRVPSPFKRGATATSQ